MNKISLLKYRLRLRAELLKQPLELIKITYEESKKAMKDNKQK